MAQSSVDAFVDSLPLEPSVAAGLKLELSRGTETNALSQACTVAQKLLGPEIVNTAPLNQSDVDANW